MTRTVRPNAYSRLSHPHRLVAALLVVALFGLLSSEWMASLILIGIAILTPTLVAIKEAVQVMAASPRDPQ